MYNGIGLTTPRGRYVFYRYLLKSASLNKLLLSAVQMVTSSVICPFCGPTTPKMTVLTLGMLPRQSIANQTRRYLNTKENGRWRSSAWSFSLSWKIKSEFNHSHNGMLSYGPFSFEEDEIERQVTALRERLLSMLPPPTSAKSLKPSDTHALAAAKKLELNKMATALGTRSDYTEGDAFNREKQEELRQKRMIEREERDQRREEERRRLAEQKEKWEQEKREKERLRRREEDMKRHERRSRSPIRRTMPLPTSPRRRRPSSRSPSPPPRRRRYDSRSPPRDYRENRQPPRRSPPLNSRRRRSPSPYSRPMSRSPSRSPRYRSRADRDRASPPRKRSPSPAYHSDRAASRSRSRSPRDYTPSPRGRSPTRSSRSRSPMNVSRSRSPRDKARRSVSVSSGSNMSVSSRSSRSRSRD